MYHNVTLKLACLAVVFGVLFSMSVVSVIS